MYELIHEGEEWILYVDGKRVDSFPTIEEGVKAIEERKKGDKV